MGEPELIKGRVNTKLHEGGSTYSADGNVMLFSRNNIHKGFIGSSSEGVIRLKTYRAELVKNKWKKIEGIPFNDDEYSVGHPSLSKDNKTLYFASDMPGGEGGTDIWMVMVDLEENKWGKPVNLGPEVNTPGNELFPWISPDETLYFASNGHKGLGGLDIIMARNFNTSEPIIKNMGYPINSSRDDFGLILDNKRGLGFFTSNRNNGEGDDDIYSFRKKQVFKAIVVDAETGMPVENARVELYDIDRFQGLSRSDTEGITNQGVRPNQDYFVVVSKNGYEEKRMPVTSRGVAMNDDVVLKIPLEKSDNCAQPFNLEGVVKNDEGKLQPGTKVRIVTREMVVVADENGEIAAELQPETDYTVFVDDPLHKDKLYEVTTKGKDPEDPVPVELIIKDPKIGQVFYIIYYDYDMHNIRARDARPELDRVVNFMQKNPLVKVALESHTDARASHPYNENLSRNRAIEAYTYITNHGIAKNRLRYAWKGETEPTNECVDGVECSEEAHQRNRRTEFSFDGYTGQ